MNGTGKGRIMETDINQKVQSLLNDALGHYAVENYHDSIEHLKAAEAIDRNNPEIIYNLGIAYSRIGLHKTALQYFDRIKELPFSFIEAQNVSKLIAFSEIQLSRYEDAAKKLENIIRESPRDIQAHAMMGYILEKTEKLDEALVVFQTILELDPDNGHACNSLAYLHYLKNENLKTALQHARKALEKDKNNPAYNDTMGCILMKLKQYDTADRFFTRALKGAPMDEEILTHYATLKNLRKILT